MAAPTVTIYGRNTGTAGKIYDTSTSTEYDAFAQGISTGGFTPTINNVSTTDDFFQLHYTLNARL